MKSAEQWSKSFDWPCNHAQRIEAIRQIQADALRWAASALRGDALTFEQQRLSNKANELDPNDNPT